MAHCYIIFSPKLNRYYIGSTSELLDKRIEKHNTGYYGKKQYTSISDDWELFHSIRCHSMDQALSIENHLKRMKSRKYLENLKRYPEIGSKLLEKYR